MNRHLSEQQMSEWALGERSSEMEQHVRNCLSCHAEVSHAVEVLAQFRKSVRRWSEEQLSAEVSSIWEIKEARPWISIRKFGWACLIVAVCILAGPSVVLRHNQPNTTDPAVADAELLRQVDRHVSRAVPRSMEPLASLVLWDRSYPPETSKEKR